MLVGVCSGRVEVGRVLGLLTWNTELTHLTSNSLMSVVVSADLRACTTCEKLTLVTLAVRPAALEDLPEVYTALGRNLDTYFRIWDLAQEGSPTIAMLMSPLKLIP